MNIGDRVKYIGKEGVGYPYRNEIGKVTQTAGTMVRVTLRDGESVNLPESDFKAAPIAVPIIGYSLAALLLIGITWKSFR